MSFFLPDNPPAFTVQCCILNCRAAHTLTNVRNVHEAKCLLIESDWADITVTLDGGAKQYRWLCPRCAKVYQQQMQGRNDG